MMPVCNGVAMVVQILMAQMVSNSSDLLFHSGREEQAVSDDLKDLTQGSSIFSVQTPKHANMEKHETILFEGSFECDCRWKYWKFGCQSPNLSIFLYLPMHAGQNNTWKPVWESAMRWKGCERDMPPVPSCILRLGVGGNPTLCQVTPLAKVV